MAGKLTLLGSCFGLTTVLVLSMTTYMLSCGDLLSLEETSLELHGPETTSRVVQEGLYKVKVERRSMWREVGSIFLFQLSPFSCSSAAPGLSSAAPPGSWACLQAEASPRRAPSADPERERHPLSAELGDNPKRSPIQLNHKRMGRKGERLLQK